jgi:hypothetical protein
MNTPEPTDLDYVRSLVREATHPPEFGRVVKVRVRDDEDKISNHEATVDLLRRDQILVDVALLQPASDSACVPQKDDIVLVGFSGAEADQPVVLGYAFADKDSDRAPVAEEGDIRIKRGDVEVEVDASEETARLKSGPPDDPTEVVVSSSGIVIKSDTSVSVEADGGVGIESGSDVTIDGDASVTVDGGTIAIGKNGTKVAVQGHTHNVGGNTTSTPNEPGTETTIR